jgi:REP element-mobilizing transposase RayT
MARPLRIQYPGAFYHVACRGNARKRIFFDDGDRSRFLTFLTESLDTYQVVLHAYALMPNHFHLLVQTMRANLSEFMRRFNICYTGWFNYRHGLCGHLYQGRYKALLVDADSYLLEVSRYIHLNVVRKQRVRSDVRGEKWQYLRKYRWSSLPGYLDKKRVVNFVTYDMILSMSGDRRSYRDFILDGLRRGISDPFKKAKYQMFLGDDDFVTRVRSKYLEAGSRREQPSYRHLTAKVLEPKVILEQIAEVMSIKTEVLSNRKTQGVARGIAADLLYRYSGLTQIEIGKILGGVDYCAVSQLRRRLKHRMAQDQRAARYYRQATTKVKRICHM